MDLVRKSVVDCLLKVDNSGFSNLVLSSFLDSSNFTQKEKAFASNLFYGTIERKITLNYILQKHIKKPIEKIDKEIAAIMQSALYQILYMDAVPSYAAINQAVSLCPVYKKTSAKGLVNAVLRKSEKFDIENEKFKDEITALSVKYSVNSDIVKIIQRDYPDMVCDILQSFFNKPKFTIRINTTKISVSEYLKQLSDKGFEYLKTPLEDVVELLHKGDVKNIYGFNEGYFYVQGVTSSYAVKAAQIKENDTVLDLCAAPGGKSFAAAIDLKGGSSVTSCDPNVSRLKLIQNGAERLGLKNINTVQNLGQVYNESLMKYNIVICDVPCSGIGIIPKKPDLRYKSMQDNKQLADLQYDILSTACKYVKEKGKIVYSTCTINKDENEAVVDRFLKEHTDFALIKQNCPVENIINNNEKITFLSHLTGFDGFFVAVFEKMW